MVNYFEQVVRCERPQKRKKIIMTIAKWLCGFVALNLFALAFLAPMLLEEGGVYLSIAVLIGGAAAIVAAILIHKYSKKLNLEYDYLLDGQTFTITQIADKTFRKKLFSVSTTQFEKLGHIESPEFAQFAKNRAIKIIEAVSNPHDLASIHYILMTLEGVKTLLIFQPSQAMLIAIKRDIPKKVFINQQGYVY